MMTCQARHDLAHRVVVISPGQVVFECDAMDADRLTLGSHRGGHNGEHSGGHLNPHESTQLPIAA